MAENCPNPKADIHISGIKLSNELVQFNWVKHTSETVAGSDFFRLLAENRVNISFLCTGTLEEGKISCCCVETEYFDLVKKLLEQAADMRQDIEILPHVGTLTLYPHRCNLKLLGLVMSELGKAGIPVYAIGTSISALTLSTDYRLLNRAVDILGEVMNLPPNHAPFRPEFRIKQL